MKRTNYEINDIQRIIWTMLKAKTGALWTSWEFIMGWPEASVFATFAKPFVYLMPPVLVETIRQQGGLPGSLWSMTVGAWDDQKTGGSEEITILGSQLLYLFRDPYTCHSQTFTIAIGGTTYTTLTLLDHGIHILSANGPREIATIDEKEYRIELTLTIRT